MADTQSYRNNLKLLWWLRNFAICGQAIAVYFAKYNLQIPLPVNHLWLVITLLAAVNALTLLRLTFPRIVTEREFFGQLLIDIFALAAVLYFSGGASNPFSSLFLLQLIIAATTLSPGYTWIIAATSLVLYTSLMYFKVDMEYIYHHHIGQFFSIHLHGMWISFILLVLLISWFVVRMNATIKRQNLLIAESEKAASMGALAAIAAHELGTPLATISILTSELEQSASTQIIREQIARCKSIISEISMRAGEMKADSGKRIDLKEFITETTAHWHNERPEIVFSSEIEANAPLTIIADYGLTQAISNILGNAADASPQYVHMHTKWNERNITITITDHGSGLNPQQISPGFTTKPDGFGLGIYLSKIVISRLGGSLDFKNAKQGLIAQIKIPVNNLKI